MGIETSMCKCKCEGPDQEVKINTSKNTLEKSDNAQLIDMPKLFKINNQFLFDSFKKKYSFLEECNDNNLNHTGNNIQLSLNTSNKLKSKQIERQKLMSSIIAFQSLFRGFYYRQCFPKIKNTLLEYLKKKIDCTKIRFQNQTISNIENSYGKYDPNSWKKYYDQSKAFLFEYSSDKYGPIYECKILIYKEIYYYTGYVSIDYQRNGYGVLVDIYGTKKEGNWIRDKLNGWCRIIDNEGNLSEGLYIDIYSLSSKK